MRLTFSEVVRRNRRIGAVSDAWCAGYRAGLARRALRPGEYVASLATWWRRGYRHALERTAVLEQLELLDPNRGGGATDVRDHHAVGPAVVDSPLT